LAAVFLAAFFLAAGFLVAFLAAAFFGAAFFVAFFFGAAFLATFFSATSSVFFLSPWDFGAGFLAPLALIDFSEELTMRALTKIVLTSFELDD